MENGEPMHSFKLTPDTMERLTVQFTIFLSDREKIHALLGDYVADYRSFKGTALARYEYLREKYASRTPGLTHLIFDADGELYWGTADISILLGRDSSTVTRMMRKIETLDGWRSRLYGLRRSSGPGVYVYKKEIFDFIIDFYEEEYLQRFVAPRRGEAAEEEEKAEIYRFWNALKWKAQNRREEFLHDGAVGLPESLPELPPLTLREVLRLLFARIFTIKTGAFFTVLFAFCYELSRRWNFFHLWIPALSAAIFAACVFGIRRGKFNLDHLTNAGAGALLFCFLWFTGLMANDDVRIPGGPAVTRPSRHRVVMNPLVFGNNEGILFNVEVENIREVKEIFYRIDPETEYRPTGFMPTTNPITGLPYPKLSIPGGATRGVMKIDVKYTDSNGTERGPYDFTFDLDRIFLDAIKKSLIDSPFWFNLDYEDGFSQIRLNRYAFNELARAGIEKILYGLNKDVPDVEWPPGSVHVTVGAKIQYISARVLFKDGASTDVKVFENF
jgi:hypothetical protein